MSVLSIAPADIDGLSIFSFFHTDRSLYENQTHSRLIEGSTPPVPDPSSSVSPQPTLFLTRGSVHRLTPMVTSKKKVVSRTPAQKTTSAVTFSQATTITRTKQQHETTTKCLLSASANSNSAYCVSNFGCVTGQEQRSLAAAIGLTTIRDMHEAVEQALCLKPYPSTVYDLIFNDITSISTSKRTSVDSNLTASRFSSG